MIQLVRIFIWKIIISNYQIFQALYTTERNRSFEVVACPVISIFGLDLECGCAERVEVVVLVLS